MISRIFSKDWISILFTQLTLTGPHCTVEKYRILLPRFLCGSESFVFPRSQCENYGNLLSHICGKNFVKITVLLKKLLYSWFDGKKHTAGAVWKLRKFTLTVLWQNHWIFFSSNQLFSNFFNINVTFTIFCQKCLRLNCTNFKIWWTKIWSNGYRFDGKK